MFVQLQELYQDLHRKNHGTEKHMSQIGYWYRKMFAPRPPQRSSCCQTHLGMICQSSQLFERVLLVYPQTTVAEVALVRHGKVQNIRASELSNFKAH